MLFDTLELAKALQPSFTPEQAEAFAHALSKASIDQLATKADLVELKSDIVELKAHIGELKADIVELRSSTKADIAEVKADIVELKASTKADFAGLKSEITSQISALRAETIKWIVSALAFNFVATAGLIITLTKVFGK